MNFPISWWDIIFSVLLILGVVHGRKRGMSMELLPVLQVIIIVLVGSQIYKPLGKKFSESTDGNVDLWLAYVIVYLVFAMIVHTIFNGIKTAVGEKLVGSDMFGSMEYYLGMLSGLVRHAGLILMLLAVSNARSINYQEVAAHRKEQEAAYGNAFIRPSWGMFQIAVFDNSKTGKFAREKLHPLLIEPTMPQPKAANPNTIGRKKERALDEVMGGGSKK